AYSGVGSIGLTRTSLPLNHRSSKYVRVLQVGTLKYLEKLSRDSSSSSLSPRVQLSDSGYLYTFNLFFTAFLFTFRPTNYLIRTVSSDAF
ncbi:hypothetical protein L249_8364, partial [Ophiocordyceps polyrhachis-furcata BCC 54312]